MLYNFFVALYLKICYNSIIMRKAIVGTGKTLKNFFKKVTSIVKSIRSRPKNKHKRRNFKKYKGQGK